MNQSLMRAHSAELITGSPQGEPVAPQGLTKVEQITAKNLKIGLYIFLLLALIGAALDQI